MKSKSNFLGMFGGELASKIKSRLQSRNVTVGGHRTSLRLEQDVWDALEEICARETLNVHELCTHIEKQRDVSSRTASVRAYVLSYFRAAASDTGHIRAGHGTLGQTKISSVDGMKKGRTAQDERNYY